MNEKTPEATEKKGRLTVHIYEGTKERLREFSYHNRRTWSDVVEKAILKYVKSS